MLLPKRQKFRKSQRLRGSFKGVANSCNRLSFGSFGLKATEICEVSSRQLEAARRAMTRYMKRGGKVWIRIFPHRAITQKAAEVPMGSGKGTVEKYVAMVKPGTVIFEMEGIDEKTAKEALRLAGSKLPVMTRFISSREIK
ncbi:MAG: 50S ribosomal protein L16 [uncultured bacterium]|nr:MAG: 50S ribosomal protein L16 [uncultured bacterium]KKT02462.1 MAG: 50S ribosomal protein L16, large subunit ribosomal protein L16 [Candidatus Peregrinibacteria bacterium GW2011_GWF2_43_17]KKT19307.1 MAG: 50S ribosomal protein L16 [Candidatus Peregrinibacteria bacterium GW2011_GWA2_43_8]HAU40184.1 50S ribosomal protein L16 [Candidatus Peregrinibacteria bacterium]